MNKRTRGFYLLIFTLSLNVCFSQDKDGIGRVEEVDGKEIYILSEPLRSFDVVLEVNTGLKAGSVITGGRVNESVDKKIDQFIRKTKREAKVKKIVYDAVLYTNGKQVSAIKFTEDDATKSGLAKVRKIDSVDIYIRCQPLREYDTSKVRGGGVKAKSYFTSGLINNSIEEDVEQFVRILLKANKNIEGILYSSGKKATGIIFK